MKICIIDEQTPVLEEERSVQWCVQMHPLVAFLQMTPYFALNQVGAKSLYGIRALDRLFFPPSFFNVLNVLFERRE